MKHNNKHPSWIYNKELELIFDSINNHTIIIFDTKGIITTSNKAVEKFFGYTKQEFVGNHFSIIFTPEDIRTGLPGRGMRIALKEGQYEGESLAIRKDKSHLYIASYTAPLYDTDTNHIGFIKIISDITDRKRFEQQRDDFINTAGHEFKIPISSMKIFIELLKIHLQHLGDEKGVSLINKIQQQNERLLALVNNLLDVAKITAEKIKFHKSTFIVDEWLQETIEEVQVSTKQGITFENGLSVKIHADKNYLTQVMVNLLTNAIKYSPEKSPVIVREQIKNNYVIISVQDFGIGIPPGNQKKLFSRFFRVGGTKMKNKPGLGLGLFISKGIIEQHGGKMWFESEEGKGSIFYFSLPLAAN